MGSTPIYAIPYVESIDALANFPAADKAQATAVETALAAGGDYAWAKQGSAQALPSGSVTLLSGLSLDAASRGSITLSGTNGLKIGKSGLYSVVAIVTFQQNTAGARSAFLQRNGNNYLRVTGAVGTSATPSIVAAMTLPLTAGDVIGYAPYQSSGAALNTDPGSNGCSIQIAQL